MAAIAAPGNVQVLLVTLRRQPIGGPRRRALIIEGRVLAC
jgi:hypothetical protein